MQCKHLHYIVDTLTYSFSTAMCRISLPKVTRTQNRLLCTLLCTYMCVGNLHKIDFCVQTIDPEHEHPNHLIIPALRSNSSECQSSVDSVHFYCKETVAIDTFSSFLCISLQGRKNVEKRAKNPLFAGMGIFAAFLAKNAPETHVFRLEKRQNRRKTSFDVFLSKSLFL